MMNNNKNKLSFVTGLLLSVLFLSGCNNARRGEPEYAPVIPETRQPVQQVNGAIYQSSTSMLLFEDIKARRVGDMLTVNLEEKTDADKKASTSADKANTTTITPPTILGRGVTSNATPLFDTSLSSSHKFSGKGDSSQSNNLSGSVTVMVTEVLSNGNLRVQGEKWITINQGEEFVRLRGIVRPIDITSDNSISSTKVANAQIVYSGADSSTIASANTLGWLAKFFISALLPF